MWSLPNLWDRRVTAHTIIICAFLSASRWSLQQPPALIRDPVLRVLHRLWVTSEIDRELLTGIHIQTGSVSL